MMRTANEDCFAKIDVVRTGLAVASHILLAILGSHWGERAERTIVFCLFVILFVLLFVVFVLFFCFCLCLCCVLLFVFVFFSFS